MGANFRLERTLRLKARRQARREMSALRRTRGVVRGRRAADAGRTERRVGKARGQRRLHCLRGLSELRRCARGNSAAKQPLGARKRSTTADKGAGALRLAELVFRRADMRDGAEAGICVGVDARRDFCRAMERTIVGLAMLGHMAAHPDCDMGSGCCGWCCALRSRLNRACEIIRQRLRRGRHFILKRCILPDPESNAAVRILLLGQRRLMQNSGVRDLDVIGEVRAQIETLVSLFRRGTEIAGEQRDVRDVFRIGYDVANKIIVAAWASGRLGHIIPP